MKYRKPDPSLMTKFERKEKKAEDEKVISLIAYVSVM
jgi:hypothetical protein